VGHFEAKFLVERLPFALISMDRKIREWLYYKLQLEVFTQRNFAADLIRLKLTFIQKKRKNRFLSRPLGIRVMYALRL